MFLKQLETGALRETTSVIFIETFNIFKYLKFYITLTACTLQLGTSLAQ